MGCYGIGINRIVAGAVEAGHDGNGIIWPLSLAPYQVVIVPASGAERGRARARTDARKSARPRPGSKS